VDDQPRGHLSSTVSLQREQVGVFASSTHRTCAKRGIPTHSDPLPPECGLPRVFDWVVNSLPIMTQRAAINGAPEGSGSYWESRLPTQFYLGATLWGNSIVWN
jgi:hypothetical protein